MNLADLLLDRPKADASIKEDLPNELGIGNHRPNPNAPEDDNHHMLTGSKPDGTLYTAEGNMATCLDWTSSSRDNTYTAAGTGRPRIGFSWSIQNRTNWISGQTEGGCGAGVTGVRHCQRRLGSEQPHRRLGWRLRRYLLFCNSPLRQV